MSTPRRTVPVDLGARGYTVHVGAGLLEEAGALIGPHAPRGRVFIVADATAWRFHGARLLAGLAAADIDAAVHETAPGEGSKSFAELERVCAAALAIGLERDEPVVAFGGGVVGDLAGLAAALIKRGAPFVQVPTTVLAQVDSSVGGKTGINTPEGKNLVGAFHQPALVLADVGTLATLDARDRAAGLAEVVKMGVIADPALFDWTLEAAADLTSGDDATLVEAVARAVAGKAAIVAEDERERGRRALLNLGHTFGHAFEAEAGYESGLRHGEAVAAGMVTAARYAATAGVCAPEVPERIETVVRALALPGHPRDLVGAPFDAEAVLARMMNDKKNAGGRLRLVLPDAIGSARVVTVDGLDSVRAHLEAELT